MKNNINSIVIRTYIRSRLPRIIRFCIFSLIFAGVFFLYDANTYAVLYAALICAVICVFCAIYDFSSYYKKLSALLLAADVITESLDSLPRPENAVDRAYTDMIRRLYKDRNAVIAESTGSRNQMQDYYAMWVHQIKVPISAMHMLLQDQEKSSPMNVQLFKIEQYVSMALSYVRLESEQTDYVIKQYSLDSIVKQSVRKYAPLFISKKIRLDIEDTDLIVNTDEKWLGFVIEQILSNSLKYTSSGSISISYVTPKTLIISDTGIGIAPEDIPRIGEKGFTGYNGRTFRKSTGLGLYLCKEILTRLSHSMAISSEVGKGTTVKIDLQTYEITPE